MTTKTRKIGLAALCAAVLFPSSAVARDNFTFLEQMKHTGASVRALSPEQDKVIQGANWSLVRRLLVANVKIYGRVGWELGRLISIRQYGIDPGAYPGLQRALSGRF